MDHIPNEASATQPSLFLSLAKEWRLVRNCLIAGLLVALVSVLVLGARYTSTVSFIPQGSRSGQMRGLAAQLGFDVAGNEGAESPYFYVELLRTKEVLSHVVKRRYSAGDRSGDYATILGISTSDSAVRTDKAIKSLQKRVSVLADRRTGIVTIEVTEKDPQLSLQLASALLEEIARYNRESRQSRAAAERRFVESRLAAARREVKVAEDSLQTFLMNNRQFRTSPELTFQFDRLQRSVTQHALVVSSLAQNFEQTRIDEVRDTPVFSVVQPPRLPPRANPRGWLRMAAFGVSGGLVLAFLLLILLGGVERLRSENPEEYRGWLATLRDMRRNVLRF
jgi:uncharacterized protein involved in exopolysaccharide biosynthesis